MLSVIFLSQTMTTGSFGRKKSINDSIGEMLSEIHTMEKCDFLKAIVYSQMFQIFVM